MREGDEHPFNDCRPFDADSTNRANTLAEQRSRRKVWPDASVLPADSDMQMYQMQRKPIGCIKRRRNAQLRLSWCPCAGYCL